MEIFEKNVYLEYLKSPVDPKAFLLEAGQGKNINGNMYAFLRELRTNQKWLDYKVYMVATKDTFNGIKERLAFYKYDNVNIVIRDNDEYKKLLATCKFLITDNSFPTYYVKRDEQVMLNTWHGTPLKTLGRCDIVNSSSIANVQKNFTTSDYVLFPNDYTRDIFMEDYCLKNICKNKVIMADYPRNVAFYNEELKKEIRDKYQLTDKEVFAYMPTWRGTSRNADIKEQQEITRKYLEEIDVLLNDNQVLYVNLHFLIGNSIDLSQMKHVRVFPKEYETYDFLNVVDVLISDYSSVFFDFANTGKKIVLFTYDLEEYIASRGMYFSIEELPFPRVKTVQELVDELNNKVIQEYEEFRNKFCNYANKDVVAHILDYLVFNENNGLVIQDSPYNGKENVFIHINLISNTHQKAFIMDYLNKLGDDKNYIVLFKGKISSMMIEVIQQLPKHLQIYGYVIKNEFTFFEKIAIGLGTRVLDFNKNKNKLQDKAFKREAHRRFGALRIDHIVNLFDISRYISKELVFLNCKTTHIEIPSVYYGIHALRTWFTILHGYQKRYFNKIEKINERIIDEENRSTFYNSSVFFIRLFSRIKDSKEKIKFSMLFLTFSNLKIDYDNMNIGFGELTVKPKFLSKKGIRISRRVRLNFVSYVLDKEDLISLSIQNRMDLIYQHIDGNGFRKGVNYSALRAIKSYSKSKVMTINAELCCYFRRAKSNAIYLTVRPMNVTDKRIENIKLNLAYYLSKFINKKIYLLFEKDSSRYEESASVVYEKMIDKGYTNAYFVLDRNYSKFDSIPFKYRKNIIYKYTFKHYLYFFICDTFLGSEALIHVLELRCNNKYVLKKIDSKENNYVFLQHGVMYMISLDSESRTFFKPRDIKNKGKYRVVTSSKKEADHFIELGNHDPSQVVICGLPKFDKNQWNEDADKIVVMPTWRPWEYNEAHTDFKLSNYYKMLVRIYESIDEKYLENLIILPHPLFYKATQKSEFELKKYMLFDVKYDDILKNTKVLITDYSSIAYDAFYRGCNVVFYWEELEECLGHYGPSTKLMLNKDNCFGDICMNQDDLKEVLEKNYTSNQSEVYISNYREIVSFKDGKNADRLLESLEKDKII